MVKFNVHAFLNSAGLSKTIVEYGRSEVIFAQGDGCDSVMYIQQGGVKLSVLSKNGREAVVAMLGPGDFFGNLFRKRFTRDRVVPIRRSP